MERAERLVSRGQDARGERPLCTTPDAEAAPQRNGATPAPRRVGTTPAHQRVSTTPAPDDTNEDAEHAAEDDARTAALVAAGDTLNCFQLESPAMRHLLRMLRARTMDATVAAVALVRPGPAESGM